MYKANAETAHVTYAKYNWHSKNLLKLTGTVLPFYTWSVSRSTSYAGSLPEYAMAVVDSDFCYNIRD